MELTLLINPNLLDDPSDFMIFIGRFHPLVVHLPIGFLLLASIAHFTTRWPKFFAIKPFLKYLWGLGAISAALAVVLGYLLSLTGDYDDNTLFWHKWSGVAVLVFALICYYIAKKRSENTNPIQWFFIVLATVTMIYTGHLGGNLTHGSTYLLEYAPNSVRSLAGLSPKKEARPKITVLDSADVYLDIVSPIMDRKCVSCHNSEKKKGGLELTTYANMMRGGENGEVIVPGDIETSELFRRITLPENHDDFMPSEGKRPLTSQEIDLIEWWIASGAPAKGFVLELDSHKKITETASHYLGLDKHPVLSKEVPPAKRSSIDSLRNQGFIINRLMKSNYFIEANFRLSESVITDKDLELLQSLNEQLIWLDLSNAELEDESLQKIGQLKHLLKLNLSGTAISDKGLVHLKTLQHLESLNVYDTDVSDGLLQLLPNLTRLQKIYLWQTKVNDSVIEQIRSERKNLQVIYSRE